jgi:hypothetical protein
MAFQILNFQWLVGLALLGTAVTYITFTRSRGGRARKASTAKTPPRSLSPEKKQSASQAATSSTDYKDVLPPPRREAMLSMKSNIPKTASEQISEEHVLRNILPMTQNYETAEDGLYTSMGISVKEVKEMGDLPDYSALSGVPLPNAYEEFKIEKALPRPYRPFRWNYHQTMCMLMNILIVTE